MPSRKIHCVAISFSGSAEVAAGLSNPPTPSLRGGRGVRVFGEHCKGKAFSKKVLLDSTRGAGAGAHVKVPGEPGRVSFWGGALSYNQHFGRGAGCGRVALPGRPPRVPGGAFWTSGGTSGGAFRCFLGLRGDLPRQFWVSVHALEGFLLLHFMREMS